MVIDNQKQAVSLRIQKSLALLLLIISIGLIYFANILNSGALGLSRDQIAGIIVALFLLFFLLHFMKDHNYIYYSDTGNKFILRYFSLRPLADKKNVIEFNKRELQRFEVKKSLSGFNERLIIYRQTTKGIAKYPPVSLTALDRQDKEKLLAALQKLILANKVGG